MLHCAGMLPSPAVRSARLAAKRAHYLHVIFFFPKEIRMIKKLRGSMNQETGYGDERRVA